MKKLSLIIIPILFSFQAFGQSEKQFYKAIAGTYLDEQSGEIVCLLFKTYESIKMCYQANEQQVPSKTKVMEELVKNVQRRWMKIRFRNSNYICEFTFAPDFETFICKNPDGTEQLFKKKLLPTRKSFAYFLDQFPKPFASITSNALQVPPVPASTKPMPIELAMKFLVSQSEGLRQAVNRYVYLLEPVPFLQQLHDTRWILYGKSLNEYVQASFHYVAQLQIRTDCYSVLFSVQIQKEKDKTEVLTYLANFDKSGKLTGLAVAASSLKESELLSAGTIVKKGTGRITKDALEVKTLGHYEECKGYTKTSNKNALPFQEIGKEEYFIDERGILVQTNRFYEDITGRYENPKTANYHGAGLALYIKKEPGRRYSGTQVLFAYGRLSRISLDFMHYELSKKEEQWGSKLWLREQGTGSVWVLGFNANHTHLKIIKSPTGDHHSLYR